MNPETASRRIGLILLVVLGIVLLVAVARATDQRRVVGYDPERSLLATCGAQAPTFFTDRDRLAVYRESAEGRVAAQPVHRGGEITGLECRRAERLLIVATRRGEHRLSLGEAPRQVALAP